ncbi:unknown protein [Seminavis robusta]|uniref:Uncharacterized protein n=1 Tax=Seminavis robusta TaxID=568900 RepID=A0A9N8HZ64_9STRA|nr:unknown protein [Seminavis robusta]|eukprot:Sro2790_g337170.1 n/a (506) ;mRNA; f:8193-9795
MGKERKPNITKGSWVEERKKPKRHGKVLKADRVDGSKHHWLVEFEQPDGSKKQEVKSSAQLSRSDLQGPSVQEANERPEEPTEAPTEAPVVLEETALESNDIPPNSPSTLETPARPKRKAAINHKVINTPKPTRLASSSSDSSVGTSSSSSSENDSDRDSDSDNNDEDSGGQKPAYNWQQHLQKAHRRPPKSDSESESSDDSDSKEYEDEPDDDFPLADDETEADDERESSDDEVQASTPAPAPAPAPAVATDDASVPSIPGMCFPNDPYEDVEPSDERDFEKEEEHRLKMEIYKAEKKALLDEEWSVDKQPEKPPLQIGSIVETRGKNAKRGKIVDQKPDKSKWIVRFNNSQRLVEKSSQMLVQVWEVPSYTWKIVEDSEPDDETEIQEYDVVGLCGFDFKQFSDEVVEETIDTADYAYPYLKLLQTLWPGDVKRQLEMINKQVDVENEERKKKKAKQLINPVTMHDFWKFIGVLISAGAFRLGGQQLWEREKHRLSFHLLSKT